MACELAPEPRGRVGSSSLGRYLWLASNRPTTAGALDANGWRRPRQLDGAAPSVGAQGPRGCSVPAFRGAQCCGATGWATRSTRCSPTSSSGRGPRPVSSTCSAGSDWAARGTRLVGTGSRSPLGPTAWTGWAEWSGGEARATSGWGWSTRVTNGVDYRRLHRVLDRPPAGPARNRRQARPAWARPSRGRVPTSEGHLTEAPRKRVASHHPAYSNDAMEI